MSRGRLVVAGVGGPIGHALVAAARRDYDVVVLTRRVDGTEPKGAEARRWNPRAAAEGAFAHVKELARVLDGADALVNLAGSRIDRGRFGPAHRHRLLDSRVHATTTLVRAAASCRRPPRAWLQGSAVGYYGDRGDEELTEASPPGSLYLSRLVSTWEAAARPASARSRLVYCRSGIVLQRHAPAWRRLAGPIRWGIGGPLGTGRQWYPWIHAEDHARAFLHLMENEAAVGPHNVTAPHPVRQADLTRGAARRLGRPAALRVPAWALRLALGGLAREMVLPSTRALPRRLEAHGFAFHYPDVGAALDVLLADPPRARHPE